VREGSLEPDRKASLIISKPPSRALPQRSDASGFHPEVTRARSRAVRDSTVRASELPKEARVRNTKRSKGLLRGPMRNLEVDVTLRSGRLPPAATHGPAQELKRCSSWFRCAF
jgi:hypothetical protein